MKTGQGTSLAKSIIIVLVIIVVTIGVTYAYFTLQVVGTPSDVNLSTGQFDLNFINSKYISVINGNLIDNENKTTEANVSLFSVGLTDSSSLNNVDYYVSLDEVVISESLYTKYFHYELLKYNVVVDSSLTNQSSCNNAEGIHFWETDENKCYKPVNESSEVVLASSHFGFCDVDDSINYDSNKCNEFKASNKVRLNNSSISLTKGTKQFLGVRVWLENDKNANTADNNQNNLMENNFSSKISILARQV